MEPVIRVIIPAINEEDSIGKVLREIPIHLTKEIIVVDNGSQDRTAEVARSVGATVLHEPNRGYGNACLRAIHYVAEKAEPTHIIVFLDGDYSDHPQEMSRIIAPLLDGSADMVIGSRALGDRQPGSMTIPQIFGNWVASKLVRLFWGVQFSDLGPFRAIKWEKLKELKMEDKTYGWTVEMQVKAAKAKLHCIEVPVTYRKRIGTSKVSGTVKGTILAGYKILWTIFKYL